MGCARGFAESVLNLQINRRMQIVAEPCRRTKLDICYKDHSWKLDCG